MVALAQSSTPGADPGSDYLYEMAIVIDELKSQDVNKKINSIKKLSSVATALGQSRTRLELLPYLIELIEDGEDEILLALAQILPEQVDLAGGVKYIFHVL